MSKSRSDKTQANDKSARYDLSKEDERAFHEGYSDRQNLDVDLNENEETPWRYDDELIDLEEELTDAPNLVMGRYGEVYEDDSEKPLPLIAIVGRPNVGKSRLYNRMTRSRYAIVADEEGITRDRQYGEGRWSDHAFQVVDTGGFEPNSADELLQQMREQAQLAIEEASVVFFVVDARAGLTPADREIAQFLREVRCPVFLLANKIDNREQELLATEFYELGVPTVYPISAEHGSGYETLMEDVSPFLPRRDETDENDARIRVAVVGRPNAGKSTFVNTLLGEERLLTSAQPGTTRDAVNTVLRTDEQEYLFIDTAGVRRKSRIHDLIEKYSVVQAFKALDRADIAIIMLDATKPFSTQDQRIVGLAHDKGCGIIFVLNKWDLVKKDHKTADKFLQQVRDDFRFVQYAPVVTISAATGQRVHRILSLIDEVYEQYTRRVSTSEANEFLKQALARRSPPQRSTRKMRFYYASQVAVRPPTFMFSVNNPGLLHFSYERFLVNQLRATFGFKGVPIKVFYRGRSKSPSDEDR